MSGIQICRNNEIENQNHLVSCEKFSNLKYLDLRENKIKTLKELKLKGLEKVFLSGKKFQSTKTS